MKTKTRTPEEELRHLTDEYLEDWTNWNNIKVYGCRDPFWEDGANMNIVRDHCIYYQARMKELCEKHSMPMPDLSKYPIPPKVAKDYMAPYCLFPDRPVCRNKTMQLSLDFGGGL